MLSSPRRFTYWTKHTFRNDINLEAGNNTANMENLSAVLRAKQDVQIENRPVPTELNNGEVSVSVRCVGICGSDIYMYTNMSHGTHAVTSGLRIGHEASGVVKATGLGVTKLNTSAEYWNEWMTWRDLFYCLSSVDDCMDNYSSMYGIVSLLVKKSYRKIAVQTHDDTAWASMSRTFSEQALHIELKQGGGETISFATKETMFNSPELTGVNQIYEGWYEECISLILRKSASCSNLSCDHVTLEPGNACNQCKNCYRGLQNMCLTEKPYSGGGEGEGYITQTKIMKESYLHRLPATMTYEEGAFMEPLAVAVHDCRRGGVVAGKSVLVQGAGTIGLLCMMTAKAMGVTNICITDVVEDRLKLAKDLGATHTYLSKSRDLDVAADEIQDVMGGAPDITIECTGNNWCQRLSIQVTIPGGTVVIVGYGDPEATLPLALAAQREITIRPSWRYDRQCFGIAIDLVDRGKVNVAALVTHRFTLRQADEAMKTASSRSPGVLKVMVNCDVTD